MTTKHTPGPLTAHKDREGKGYITSPYNQIVVRDIPFGLETLFASAPELLEALKEARDEIAFLQDKTGFKDKAKIKRYDKLIAKAGGRDNG